MSDLEVLGTTVHTSFDQTLVELDLLEVESTCQTIVEVFPVEPSTTSIDLDVIAEGTTLHIEDPSAIVLDAAVESLEILELGRQGPAGPQGLAGSGGLAFDIAVLSGENKMIYSIDTDLYTAVSLKLSIMDLVNNFQVMKLIEYTFFTPRVKCRVSGMNKKDSLNHTISYAKTPGSFDVYLHNAMPNSLRVKGLVFPI